jgi:tetratricopeptide (TPR) repeat protein
LLQDQGDFVRARNLFERALAIRQKVLSEHPVDTANSINNLGELLRRVGDLAGARPLFERAIGIFEKTLGLDHPNTNRAKCNLARLLLTERESTEALALAETALAAHEKTLRPDHSWTVDSARVTADALDALGRAEEAKALREKYGLAATEEPKAS